MYVRIIVIYCHQHLAIQRMTCLSSCLCVTSATSTLYQNTDWHHDVITNTLLQCSS